MPRSASALQRNEMAVSRPLGAGLGLLDEIVSLVAEKADLREAAQGIVDKISSRLGMEVCSIYVFEKDADRLRLWATAGLDPASVGKVTMSVNEGLTGMAIEKRQPVMAIDALVHPRYKYFPETGEERYHSFLGVPVLDRGEPVGVLVVQTSRRRRFTPKEVRLLKRVSVAVAGILSRIQLEETLERKEAERRDFERRMDAAMSRLQDYESRAGVATAGQAPASPARLFGQAASPGYGIGRALVLESMLTTTRFPRERQHSLKRELQRFEKARQTSIAELDRIRDYVERNVPEIDAAMFEAQKLMLSDPAFCARVEVAIREGLSAEAGVQEAVEGLVHHFAEIDDTYLRERAADVQDIGRRVLRHLLGLEERSPRVKHGVVLVANEIALSELTIMEQGGLKGLVLGTGGVTSHAAILARSLEIPTVVGVEGAGEKIQDGDVLIVDGNAGLVFVNPRPEVVGEYERLMQEYQAFNRDLEALRDLPAETPDGHRVRLWANIGLLGDVYWVRRHGAEGVGLYRTEVAFMSHREFLDEEEQFEIYRRVVEAMEGKPVTIRTLDLGADKYPRFLHRAEEENPFLGWRSIRISLEMPELFKEQLRAILRASAYGPVRLMFPMISSLEEILRAKELLAEAREEVIRAGHGFDPQMPVGIMIEVPSAVYLASALVREVDFVSIGTNDLIQYLLAVDRNNRKVAGLYEPLHPAVLQAIANVVHAAKAAGRPVSLCGEMAAEPLCAALLVGIGVEDLSMSAFFIPIVKRLIRAISFEDAQSIAEEALRLATVQELKRFVYEEMRSLGVVDLTEVYH
ncbi:MAG: phosphoenolpyruvate--protein phosphotransferase [Candidatus Binatia bacterium]|nr:MAG: phosphoenolpyruvate--protein phosphotransferase [Candidatus Binatia bacterium]